MGIGSAVVNDLPYFEPLLIHLKTDELLEPYFSGTDFFAQPKLREDIETLIKEDCPIPRALYIYPAESRPKQDSPKGCFAPMTHNFHVFIFVQCLDNYYFVKNEDESLSLKGQVILLSEMRNAVKKSIGNFAKQIESELLNYNYIKWLGDSAIDKEAGFLVSETVFSIDIYK